MPRPTVDAMQEMAALAKLLRDLLERADKQGYVEAEAEIEILGRPQKVKAKVFLPPK